VLLLRGNLTSVEHNWEHVNMFISEYSVMYRSGTVASGPSKADLLSAQNGLVGRPLNRSDQDSGFHPTNKRERQVVLDKEMPNPRTINK
jgi:hypothetical protein